jgi:bifunctional non-homologous end joining protein LigD
VDAALEVRDVLAHLELTTFVKTSGGKGLHVVAPLTGEVTWSALKQFARAVAEHLAQQKPDVYTAKIAKAARTGRVFIDYLRNDRGSTAVAAYSPRAKSGAPISMPVTWEELPKLDNAAEFTIPTAMERVSKGRDPWRGFFTLRQKLPEFAMGK